MQGLEAREPSHVKDIGTICRETPEGPQSRPHVRQQAGHTAVTPFLQDTKAGQMVTFPLLARAAAEEGGDGTGPEEVAEEPLGTAFFFCPFLLSAISFFLSLSFSGDGLGLEKG